MRRHSRRLALSTAAFRQEPELLFGVLAEVINGWMATSVLALTCARTPGSPWQRGLVLGLTMWFFWVVSGTMSAYVFLDIPASLAWTNVLFGLPKSLVISWALAWLWGPDPEPQASQLQPRPQPQPPPRQSQGGGGAPVGGAAEA